MSCHVSPFICHILANTNSHWPSLTINYVAKKPFKKSNPKRKKKSSFAILAICSLTRSLQSMQFLVLLVETNWYTSNTEKDIVTDRQTKSLILLKQTFRPWHKKISFTSFLWRRTKWECGSKQWKKDTKESFHGQEHGVLPTGLPSLVNRINWCYFGLSTYLNTFIIIASQ